MTTSHQRPIAIIDYGMGNLASVANALRFLNVPSCFAGSRLDLDDCAGIILPGVGAFGEAMINLRARDLIGPMEEQVREHNRPFLGICLGMQLLAEHSFELGEHEGLGWIEGKVERLPAGDDAEVPHVGWASLDNSRGDPILQDLMDTACFYFDHSYRMIPSSLEPVATTRSGVSFAAIVRQKNVVATQFHPEKSQRAGLRLLRNFSNSCVSPH